ncbi:MAG TPA: hypothetical protein VGE72_13560, partial [Azospirillum sp.]
MLRRPVRILLSLDPRAALLATVLTMGLLGGVSWGAMTALDYIDTLRRAEYDTLRAAVVLEGHARAVIAPRLATLRRVADRLRGHDRRSFVETALGEALAAPYGVLAVVDRDGQSVFGPSVTLAGDRPALRRAIAEAESADGGTLAVTGRFDGTDALLLGERVAGPDGRGWGAVLVAVPLSSLSAVLNAFDAVGAGVGIGGGDGSARRSTGLYRLDGAPLAGGGGTVLGALPPMESGADPAAGQVAGHWP